MSADAHRSISGAGSRTSASRSPYGPYAPRLVADWDVDHPDTRWFSLEATSLLLDVTGFTSVSERLARLGPIGAEQLTDLLDHVFSRLLEVAYEKGGHLLKFGGDALLLAFSRDDHARLGLEAAVAMRHALAEARTTTGIGRVELRASMGLHTGTLHLFRAGTISQELLVAGPDCSTTLLLERTASSGEILLSDAMAARLPPSAVGRTDHGLRARTRRVVPGGPGRIREGDIANSAIDAWIPTRLRTRLAERAGESEHRLASLAFVRLSGLDRLLETEGADAVSAALDEVVGAVQQVAEENGVTLLGSDADVDGCKLILATGVPAAQEDDEGRILRAARSIGDQHGVLDLHVGVNRGPVFAGDVGTAYRRTFTVIGDAVNVAARLAAAAPPGGVFASGSVLEHSRTIFDAMALGPVTVKGRRDAVATWSVGAPLGARHREAGALPFVGRDDELAALVAAREAATTGAGSVSLVEGERGAGKTRVVTELAAALAPDGVLRVQGEAFGTGVPYYAFRAAVRQMLGVTADDPAEAGVAVLEAVARSVPELVPLAPLLGPLTDATLAPTAETKALADRFVAARRADVLVQLLDAQLPGPLLIVLEDAHWFDGASCELAATLASATHERPWLLCVTRRPTGSGFTPSDASPHVVLGPLPDAAVAELIDAGTTSTPLRPQHRDAIVAKAGGNPLFVEELLRVVAEGGVDTVPDSLDAIAMREIDALPSDARRLVLAASVLGRHADLGLLAALLGAKGLDAGRHGLGDLLSEDGMGQLIFRHMLLQEAAYSSLPFRVRRDLHRRAGRAIEAARSSFPDASAMLSLHFAEAQDWERAWRYARLAAADAQSAHAPGEVITHLERAAVAGRHLSTVRDALVAAVLEEAAEATILVGDYERADATFHEATKVWQSDLVARARIAERRAYLRLEYQGRLPAAIRQIHSGVALLAEMPDARATRVRAALLAREAHVRYRQGRFSQAVTLAQGAAEAAERAGDDRVLALALSLEDQALAESGRAEEPVHLARALELYERLGALDVAAMTLGNLGSFAYFQGDWSGAGSFYARSAEAAATAGDLATAAVAQVNLGELRVDQGRADEAIEVLRPAMRTLASFGYVAGVTTARMHLGRAKARAGEADEGVAFLREAVEQFGSAGHGVAALDARAKLAESLLLTGDLAGARSAMDDARRAERALGTSAFATLLDRVDAGIAVAGRDPEAASLLAAATSRAREAGATYDLCVLLTLSASIGGDGGAEAAAIARDLGVVSLPLPATD